MKAGRSWGKNGQKKRNSLMTTIWMRNFMLSLKFIFIFCESTTCWRKMRITEQVNLNKTSQKK